MTKTLLSSGLIAGAVAGLVMALLQFWLIQPLIVQAERYETGELVLHAAQHRHGALVDRVPPRPPLRAPTLRPVGVGWGCG